MLERRFGFEFTVLEALEIAKAARLTRLTEAEVLKREALRGIKRLNEPVKLAGTGSVSDPEAEVVRLLQRNAEDEVPPAFRRPPVTDTPTDPKPHTSAADNDDVSRYIALAREQAAAEADSSPRGRDAGAVG